MLPTAEHRTTPETAPDEAPLVVGDLGVVVLRALLENGVGYVVSSWRDRPTPIDAAIDDARERILVPRGVVLRRLRSLAALEPIIAAPSGGITGHPPRGAVVFAGRRGLRPALEQFLAIAASGGIVGFCFDDDAARIEDALVIDPEPTAVGIARAIDAAFVASVAAGRPALVVIRERALGLRGAIRVRADRSPVEAAELDAHQRSEAPHATVAEAAEAAGLVAAHRAIAATTPAGERPVLVVSGPLRQAAERALAQVSASLVAAGATPWTDAVAVVDARAPGVVPAAGGAVAAVLADSTAVCVLGARAARVAERIASAVPHPRVTVQPVDPGTARGEQLVGAIAAWVLERAADELDDPARATLADLAEARPGAAVGLVDRSRLPRRSEALGRSVPSTVAAGLVLAQGVVGVPARLDVEYPTYRTDTGVPLTVVPAALFAAHGLASAAPGSGVGVFLVTQPDVDVTAAAASVGASVEHVDGGSPRAIGAAVGRACRTPRLTPHVIVVAAVQRVAGPRRSAFGMDPDLVGTERLATSAVPPEATVLVDLGDDLVGGPAVIALDVAASHAALDAVRELSPATWDLQVKRGTRSALARTGWNTRRRLVRSIAGVDL